MRKVRVFWRGKELRGIEIGRKGKRIRLRLENGYEVFLEPEGVEVLGEVEVEIFSGEFLQGEEVAILSTGGTIASVVDYTTGGVSPLKDPSRLFPFLSGRASFRNVMGKFSEDMEPSDWTLLAKEVSKEVKRRAVVILHGTDTMTYTSSALSLCLGKPSNPVILIGAQRSSDRPSSDAFSNFRAALAFSLSGLPYVGISFHLGTSDSPIGFLLGSRARKMHTTRRDAIQPIGVPPLALSDGEVVEVLWRPSFPSREGPFEFNENVAFVYFHPGRKFSADALSEYDGVVIGATGMGHVPRKWIPEIRELTSSGIPVVITSQCISGRVNHLVYSNGRLLKEAGAIGHGLDVLPETALVKTMWILSFEKRPEAFAKWYAQNIAGEITERSLPREITWGRIFPGNWHRC